MKPHKDGVRIEQGDLPADLATAFEKVARIAWDVETTGLDWRQERLAALLEDPAVEKVFHHAPFDLRFIVHGWNVQPASIRCTKLASKILAPSAPNETHSLQHLVARSLGVRLTKGPARTSDWTADTLTAEQLEYAANDVLYLLPLLDALRADLEQAHHTRLYDDCCAFLPARVLLELGGYPDVFAY